MRHLIDRHERVVDVDVEEVHLESRGVEKYVARREAANSAGGLRVRKQGYIAMVAEGSPSTRMRTAYRTVVREFFSVAAQRIVLFTTRDSDGSASRTESLRLVISEAWQLSAWMTVRSVTESATCSRGTAV